MPRLTSVVIPAFNEADGFDERLARLDCYLKRRFEDAYEVVVVDDGSTDQTRSVLSNLRTVQPRLVIEEHEGNHGMDAAIRSGIRMSSGDWIVVLDADLTYAPEITGELVDRLESGAEIALASPYMRGGSSVAVPWMRRVLSVTANRYLSLAVNGRLATLTSVVRGYDRRCALRLLETGAFEESTFGVLLNAYREGARITEVPATLDWSAQPARRAARMKLARIIAHSWAVLVAGARARPLLLAAIPGLIPGLLPFVTFVALALRASAAQLSAVVAATLIVQYGSLGLLGFQLGDLLRSIHANDPSPPRHSASERSRRVRA